MAQTTTQEPEAAKVYLRCPKCASADLAAVEQLTASCRGHATLTIHASGELRPEFHPDGWSDVNWDSSTTIGVECRACLWSYEGADHLDWLVFSMQEAC